MSNLISFLDYIYKLKKVKRQGWAIRGITQGESVADHSFITAFLAMIYAKDFGMKEEKVIKMALVHDIAESVTGDIVWQKGKDEIKDKKIEKEEGEEKAIREIFSKLMDGNKYILLWEEYKNRVTPEAKFVKQMEILERTIQAVRYEKEYPGKDLSDFFSNAEMNINDMRVRKFYKEIINERKKT